MHTHLIANFLSVELNELADALAHRMTLRYGERFEFIGAGSLEKLARGQIDVAFLCGLPYTTLVDNSRPVLEPIAAARVDDVGVGKRPEYYADLVVAAEAPYRDLKDLHERVFGYNEMGSFSGYAAMRYELLFKHRPSHFARWVRTGSHKQSIESLLSGRVDAATIDSQVLLIEQKRRPQLAEQLRVLQRLGPYPMPPVVVSRNMNTELKQSLTQDLLRLPERAPELSQLVAGLCIVDFCAVTDAYYDPIRQVSRAVLTDHSQSQ